MSYHRTLPKPQTGWRSGFCGIHAKDWQHEHCLAVNPNGRPCICECHTPVERENTMTAVLLGNEIQGSPEWHALRANGIGGSEIAAIVGLSPWVSRYALYHRKRGTLGEQKVNAGMDWGHRLEPVVCAVFAELHTEFTVRSAGTYRHADRPWQLANADRLLHDVHECDAPRCGMHGDARALLEVKTAHQYDAHEWGADGTDEIPPCYRCQALWYLDVLGLPTAHFAVLIGGSDYREYVIDYKADEAEWLRNEGQRFWHDVTEGIAPDIDEHAATYEAVRTMHPEIERDVEVELDQEVYDAYAFTKADADEATGAHRKAKAELLDQMGQAHRALVGGVAMLRRQPGRGGSVSLYPIPKKKDRSIA